MSTAIFTVEIGFTIINAVSRIPAQPLNLGVIEIVSIRSKLVELIAVNDKISPKPTLLIPIVLKVPVQSNIVPGILPVNSTFCVLVFAHTDWVAGVTKTLGTGFTLISNVLGVPTHPEYTGETVKVATISVIELPFVVTKGAIQKPDEEFVTPEFANPIKDPFDADQLKEVTGFGPVKQIELVVSPAHNSILGITFTIGIGSTVVIVKTIVSPKQLFISGTTLIVAVTIVFPVFPAVNGAIFPVPEEARLILILLFVQA